MASTAKHDGESSEGGEEAAHGAASIDSGQ